MNSSGVLKIDTNSISTRMTASASLTALSNAINCVSMARAELGALQNRLEFKIQNLNNQSENIAASESRIRDADMAKMMTEFTKNSILFQASTAMLAQANSLPQSVLQLLG
jgi:flagellin